MTEDDYAIEKEDKDPEIITTLRINLDTVRNQYVGDDIISKFCDKMDKLVQEYQFKDRKQNQNSRNLFNKIINSLDVINDKLISRNELPEYMMDKCDFPQVFLSHAYDDRLYALTLFIYFYNRNIYLYVDWMHNDKINDGIELKHSLKSELELSDQLLFLRTLNNELDIQGKHMLRQWCAWELGNFYYKSQEKYMINLYSVDKYNNSQLHGLKLYTGTEGSRLIGSEIHLCENNI